MLVGSAQNRHIRLSCFARINQIDLAPTKTGLSRLNQEKVCGKPRVAAIPVTITLRQGASMDRAPCHLCHAATWSDSIGSPAAIQSCLPSSYSATLV